MTRLSLARRAPLVALLLVSLSCGDDSTAPVVDNGDGDDSGGTNPAELSIASALGAPGGGAAAAGDTILYTITVENTGDLAARDLAVTYAVPERFAFYSAGWPPEAKREGGAESAADTIDLAPGAVAACEIRLGAPAFYPDGWAPPFVATLGFDDDGADSTGRVTREIPAPAEAIANGGLPFELTAPGIPEVYLTGDFNGWGIALGEYRLFDREADDERAITVPVSGRHQYKFQLVDPGSGRVEWIADPRAARLEPDGFGGYNAVAGVELPEPVAPLAGGIDPARLVIYELFTWDFSVAADFGAIEDAVTGGSHSLADLGINAIELLPVNGVAPYDFNWGYTPIQYFAVERDYGTPEEFASLVGTAHDNGIAVILDMVFNHMGRGGPLQKIDEMGESGTYINYSQGDVFGMKQINWFSDEMRAFLLDCALFWIEQYGIDGFRMDLVDSQDYPGYAWWRAELRARHPDFLVIGEDFRYPNQPNCVTACGFDAQWGGQHTDGWGGFSNNFQQTVMALLEEDTYDGRLGTGLGSFSAADNPMWALANVMEWTYLYPEPHNEVRYIVSHDERRLSYEVEQAGSAEAALIGGSVKGKLGAVTLMTASGTPMIYMGEEIGADNWIPPDPTPNKIDWAGGDYDLRDFYAGMIRLRLNHPTLAGGGTAFFGDDWETNQGPTQQSKSMVCWRYPGSNVASTDIVVAFNFDHDDHAVTVPFPADGTWHLWDPDDGTVTDVTVGGGAIPDRPIPASTALIYLKNTDYIP